MYKGVAKEQRIQNSDDQRQDVNFSKEDSDLTL